MAVVPALGLVAASTVSPIGVRVVPTLVDSKKGSLTNRIDCLAEKTKNDVNLGLKLGIPAAVIFANHKLRPGALTKDGAKAAQYLGKVAAKLAAKFPKVGILSKIATNPVKYGKIGLLVGAGAYVLNALLGHANKDGKIDQKYNDAAALENIGKNVVLEA